MCVCVCVPGQVHFIIYWIRYSVGRILTFGIEIHMDSVRQTFVQWFSLSLGSLKNESGIPELSARRTDNQTGLPDSLLLNQITFAHHFCGISSLVSTRKFFTLIIKETCVSFEWNLEIYPNFFLASNVIRFNDSLFCFDKFFLLYRYWAINIWCFFSFWNI